MNKEKYLDGHKRIQGVASVEFALIFIIFFAIFYGLATFVDVFYKIQTVSRATAEGARLAHSLTTGGSVPISSSQKAEVMTAVYESLSHAAWVHGTAPNERVAWVKDNSQVIESSLDTAVVELRFDYGKNRLLPAIPLIDFSGWLLSDDFTMTVRSKWKV